MERPRERKYKIIPIQYMDFTLSERYSWYIDRAASLMLSRYPI